MSNNEGMGVSTPGGEQATDEIDLIQLFLVLWSSKWRIVGLTAVFAVGAVFYARSLPDIFRAEAVILPPKEADSKYSAMLGQLASIPFMNLGGGGGGGINPLDLLKAHLGTRENVKLVTDRFHLREVFKMPAEAFFGDVVKAYASGLGISEKGKTGLVEISFENKDPKLAMDIVNFNLELMQSISRRNQLTQNQRKKTFVDERFEETKAALEAAEEKIKGYLQANNLIDISAQAKATIEAVSKIHSEILVLGTKLKVRLELGANESHPEIRALKYEIEALEKQMKQLESGRAVVQFPGADDKKQVEVLMYLSLADVPTLSLEMERLMRDKLVLQEVFKTLAKEKELAKIESAKDQEMIEVIEMAQLPERKVKPRRSIICVVTTLAGFFLACFGVLVQDSLSRYRGHES